jgi:hypothetical protein
MVDAGCPIPRVLGNFHSGDICKRSLDFIFSPSFKPILHSLETINRNEFIARVFIVTLNCERSKPSSLGFGHRLMRDSFSTYLSAGISAVAVLASIIIESQARDFTEYAILIFLSF